MVWAQYMLDDSGFCGIGHVSMYSVENDGKAVSLLTHPMKHVSFVGRRL